MSDRNKIIEQAKILKLLIEIADVDIILTTFVSAFIKKTILKTTKFVDNIAWLFGNFNLGGTLSGRLSSSKINLQNLPSTGSIYAKLIKECFMAPPGWIFTGADFNSLEDMISALTTKDPNKLKVYLEGYDGHCLRAYSYYPEKLPDIINTVNSINSIKNKYPTIRQDSKTPTFALTYGGTWRTLVNDGILKSVAKFIEAGYHKLYEVADKWVNDRLIKASSDGYVTVAFGLRLRTPILKQTILGQKSTPYEASAEGRTAGNAMGQSYGMLNNRSANEFMSRVYKSKYKYDIKPIAQIHDAQYYLVRKEPEIIKWYNDNLIECMQWQELPELKHDKVKLGAEVMLFIPNWAKELKLSNNASIEKIKELLNV